MENTPKAPLRLSTRAGISGQYNVLRETGFPVFISDQAENMNSFGFLKYPGQFLVFGKPWCCTTAILPPSFVCYLFLQFYAIVSV